MLPLHTVWGLKLPNCQQIVVKVLFAFGFCVCAAGIVRTYVMYQTTTSHDKTWTSHSEWLVGGIELYLGVVSFTLDAMYFCRHVLAFSPCATKAIISEFNLRCISDLRHGPSNKTLFLLVSPKPHQFYHLPTPSYVEL